MRQESGTDSLSHEITEERVREQLNRISSSPAFRTSRRCVAFLEYVVQGAIEGRAASLKEKTLGIQVFGREPDYDPKQDSVVRVTANEVRKRLAQYYALGHQSELRIDLPPGSYLPEFHSPVHGEIPPAGVKPLELAVSSLRDAPAKLPRAKRRFWLPVVAALVLSTAAGLSVRSLRRSVVDQFWAPMLDGSEPVLICVGQPRAYNLLEPLDSELGKRVSPTHQTLTIDPALIVPMFDRYIAIGDAMCLSDVAGVFTRHNREYFIRGDASTSFADLRQSPALLIGAFTNDWTLRLMGELRFTLERDSDSSHPHVHDRLNPTKRDWQLSGEWPDWKMPVDYAIVSRVLNPLTGKMVVTAAGITQYGTAAAGEFLTKQRFLEEALRRAPRDWTHKNLQVVLRTRVIQGTAGPPQILATQFW